MLLLCQESAKFLLQHVLSAARVYRDGSIIGRRKSEHERMKERRKTNKAIKNAGPKKTKK